ncbi:exodeoxyribonuclease III [Robiginitalea aurantiaca]|uniref:Exodeoxyribonuclease III n=1 Tax=Robiginitalea aurantiaca TaxID=3056915 RepID=A0ABT7WII1_9FLAO|nr:exodeoxyribonuclease III [Robiginitalea aurantiaca]MDM9632734.1 exodeoxyribonuclease III [Robiginitalea aurantiaca]
MQLISWNVNGIRAIVQKNFLDQIRDLHPDILCLQEIKADEATVRKQLESLSAYTIYVHPAEKKGYSGTAILTRTPALSLQTGLDKDPFIPEGRVQCADFDTFYLLNVYVPNSGQGLTRLDYREQWDAAFLDYVNGLREQKPVVVCGDLNVAHRPIDLKNDKSNYNKTAGYTQTEIDGMDRLQASGLVDIYRERNPDREAYTYWSYRFKARERNTGWRIDYFLISPELRPKVKDVTIYNQVMGSDHCPIGLTLA